MGEIVGIICEYNPFHKGHKYQIDKIKEIMPTATILGIMSGNVVQRGEFALIDKYDRALIASECGLDGVFEIPYPYCGSTAEIFANAGVEIANKLGCTHLCFGLENGKIKELEEIADIVTASDFKEKIDEKIIKNRSFLEAKAESLSEYGYSLPEFSNDILALEYICAIKNKGIELKCIPVERVGAKYNDFNDNEIMSASGIRAFFEKEGVFKSIPQNIEPIYERLANEGKYLSYEQINELLFKYSVLTPKNELEMVFDSCSEIADLIGKASKNAKSGTEFLSKLTSKSFTTSRIKRVLLYSLARVYELDKAPRFTVLLCSNERCKSVLKKIRKNDDFSVITKMSDAKKLDEKSKNQLEYMLSLEKLYNVCQKAPKAPKNAYSFMPIIK